MDPHVLCADISDNNGQTSAFHAHAYKSAGHKLVMIKAMENGAAQPTHDAWAHAAHAAGLGVAHYLFCRPENGNPIGQATEFWRYVQSHLIRGRDRLVLDVETDTPAAGARWIEEADKQLVILTGGGSDLQPIGYTFASYFDMGRPRLTSKAWLIAAWGRLMPERHPLAGGQYLWGQQYTDGQAGPSPHVFAGIRGNCDGSVINRRSIRLIEQALGGRA